MILIRLRIQFEVKRRGGSGEEDGKDRVKGGWRGEEKTRVEGKGRRRRRNGKRRLQKVTRFYIVDALTLNFASVTP